MSRISVDPIHSEKDVRAFITLPYRLYKHHPVWIPPLRIEEKKNYSPRKNPLFDHCDVQHFLLRKDGRPAGRISAFINHLANEHWGSRTGLFGSFECDETDGGALLLLKTAAAWLAGRGMDVMQGPWSFASQEFGLLVSGFDAPPMIMAPYNPPSYEEHFLAFGLQKIKDLLVYEIDISRGYEMPARYRRFSEKLKKSCGITLRPLDMKNLKEETARIVSIANESTRGNWGYIPVTAAEAAELAASLKMIADPDIIMLAEIKGQPIGYMIVLPDINTLLKGSGGRLTPRTLARILWGRRGISRYRIWALGVIPEYQRKGIDTVFYTALAETLLKKKASVIEANYVLEDNMVMNNPILKLGFKESKRYRVFEKNLAEQ